MDFRTLISCVKFKTISSASLKLVRLLNVILKFIFCANTWCSNSKTVATITKLYCLLNDQHCQGNITKSYGQQNRWVSSSFLHMKSDLSDLNPLQNSSMFFSSSFLRLKLQKSNTYPVVPFHGVSLCSKTSITNKSNFKAGFVMHLQLLG